MEFINKTGNTLYLTDLDIDIPYLEDETPQNISLDDVKRSKSFRKMLHINSFVITKHGNSIFERNLVRIQKETGQMLDSIHDAVKPMNQGPPPPLEIKLRGHMYEAGGYAKVNRNLAKGLSDLGLRVQLDPLNKRNNQLTEEELRELHKIDTGVSRDAIIIDSMIPTLSNSGMGKNKVLYTTVEAATVPKQFIEIAHNYNEIWVTSDFCKEVLIKAGLKKPIYVVPDSIDTDLYHEDYIPYQFNPSLNDFVFVSVFGWGYRKGYDVLLKSYLKEFTANDPVSLLIISRNNWSTNKTVIKDTINTFIKNYGGDNPPHIARCERVIPEKEMPSIYKACHAYVGFSRGEGFGLTPCEASLCGLPVIATNFSGHTMFLNKDNSYLVDIDRLTKIQPGTMQVHYWDNQEFPSLTDDKVINDASTAMRYVFENYPYAKLKNKKLQKFIADNYNIESVCKLAKSLLENKWR